MHGMRRICSIAGIIIHSVVVFVMAGCSVAAGASPVFPGQLGGSSLASCRRACGDRLAPLGGIGIDECPEDGEGDHHLHRRCGFAQLLGGRVVIFGAGGAQLGVAASIVEVAVEDQGLEQPPCLFEVEAGEYLDRGVIADDHRCLAQACRGLLVGSRFFHSRK